MANSTVSLKLLIDTKGKRVVYAEAGKDFVDFLFLTVSLSVSKLSNLLQEQGVMSSIVNVCESVENLNESYIQPNLTKDNLLKPVGALPRGCSIPLLAINEPPTPTPTVKKLYACSSCFLDIDIYVSDGPGVICQSCDEMLDGEATYLPPPPAVKQASSGEGGFVKGTTTYIVRDDLVVMPFTMISSIELLNKFNVKKLDALEIKVVDIGMKEARKLLGVSMFSKNVLTDIFLNENTVKVKQEQN